MALWLGQWSSTCPSSASAEGPQDGENSSVRPKGVVGCDGSMLGVSVDALQRAGGREWEDLAWHEFCPGVVVGDGAH